MQSNVARSFGSIVVFWKHILRIRHEFRRTSGRESGQRTNLPGGTGGAVWVFCNGKTSEGRAVQWIDLAQGLPANRNCFGKFFASVGFSVPRRMLLRKRRGDDILSTFGLMVQGTLVQGSEVAFSGLK